MPTLTLKILLALLLLCFLPFLGTAQVTEDFESGAAAGWTTSGTASSGTFVVANPTQETSGGVVTQLEDDHTPTPGVNAYFTATNTSAGVNDVDGGTSITTSPIYNIPTASQLSIWYFFGQRDNGDDANDFFLLEYSTNSGGSFTTLASIGDVTTNASWTEATAAIPAGSNVVIRVTVSDGSGPGDIIEGGIDDLSIQPVVPTITIDDVAVDEDAGTATFTATHTLQAAAGPFTVNYTTADGSANAPGDYTASSGTLSFNGTLGDTEQIVITINDDFSFEGDETYTISFTGTSDASVNISDTATGTILDDDSNPNAPRAYEERWKMNFNGDFIMRGNTNLQCVASCPGTPTTNNPPAVMGYADVDTDATTINSSTNTFIIPAGATVEWAGLYWGGSYNSSSGSITNPPGTVNIDQVKFREPGAAGYTTINAMERNIVNSITSTGASWSSFMSYADVTSIVSAAGSGVYTVADIALITGSHWTGPFGGWNMIIVFRDPSTTTKNIAIWDGFNFFGFGANTSFTVTGLLTPATGAFQTHAGYFGFDGEANQIGDFVQINGTNLANALNPGNNTLNGTISEFGVDIGGRNPNFAYSWGIDSDVFNATGTVPNSATSANVTLGSSFEGIWGGVFVISNEIAFPVVSSKTFTPPTLLMGDEATVTVVFENPAQGVPLTNASLTDNLPPGMVIAPTPSPTSSCGGVLTATPGASFFNASSFSLAAGASCTFTFDITTEDIGNYTNTIYATDVTNNENIPLADDSSADLTVKVKTVITNRRITYRVNKD